MTDSAGVGRRGAGLVVDDAAVLNQIEDADQAGQSMAGKIGLNGHFHGIGFGERHGGVLPDVGVAQSPAGGLVVLFFTGLPLDGAFGGVRPGLLVVLVNFLERERLLQPACLVPCLQDGMHRAAKME